MRYRKKPVVINAMQFDGSMESADAVGAWMMRCGEAPATVQSARNADGAFCNQELVIATLEGDHIASPGDFVIRGVKGEFYPCKPDIFLLTYDPAADSLDVKRDVLDHRVEGKGGGADDTRVVVLDEPGQGGACHKYAVITGKGKQLLGVEFQNGPIQEVGLNGAQQEHLLAIVIDRLRSFQAGPFSSRYNAVALTKCEEGLMWLQRRTVDRVRRGVEGFNKA